MKLSINEPCNEDWNNMKIGMFSRHCEKCEKKVMDFTTKSRTEIISYLLNNTSESVCGRMKTTQLDFHQEDIPIIIEVLKKSKNPHSFLILSLVCLTLISCEPNNKYDQNNSRSRNQDKTRPEPDRQGSLDGLKTPCGADQKSVHNSSEVQENSNGPEIQQADQKIKEPREKHDRTDPLQVQ